MKSSVREKIESKKKSQAINFIENASKETSIIIDFDQTLLLRNSTAEYLNSLHPRIVGLILLKLIALIRPWDWLPKPFRGSQSRDWFLVTISTILLPWTFFLWQIKAKKLAKSYGNAELINAVRNNANSTVIIASLGFNFIIIPILKHLPIKYDSMIGCRFWQGAKDRDRGKLSMLREKLPESAIESAVVITDSIDDLPLLQVVDHPYLITWPLAKYIPPLRDIYLPFLYLEKVKRAKENYTLKVILWDDLPILLLAFSWQANHSLLHGFSILLLLVSFWCMYELGYYENDYVAENYEEKPRLSGTFYLHKQMMTTWYPWFWSLIFGLAGVAVLEKARGVSLLFYPPFVKPEVAFNSLTLPFLYWITLLVTARLCFWLYNHLNKHTRTWLYLLLQSFRYYGFLAITFTNAVGTSILSAHILSRSILYVVYRYSGGNADNWPKEVPVKLLRCLIFIFLLSAISLGTHCLELWQTWQTWAIILWCLLQGNSQIRTMLSQVKPVFEDGSNEVRTTTQ